MRARARIVVAAAAAVSLGLGSCAAAVLDQDKDVARIATRAAQATHSAPRTLGPDVLHRKLLLGHSVRHRPIVAYRLGMRSIHAGILVMGCIHGNEPAGIAVARDLGT